MRFEENRIGDVLVAKVLDARIAADVAPVFKAHLTGYLEKGERSVVLDLAAVSFIDSSGLGALISSLKALGSDGHLVISGARGTVASMFKLTRMDKVLRLFGTTEEALAAIA
jgi:anti-sigma B factor antagonist